MQEAKEEYEKFLNEVKFHPLIIYKTEKEKELRTTSAELKHVKNLLSKNVYGVEINDNHIVKLSNNK